MRLLTDYYIRKAKSPGDYEIAKKLFVEYSESLPFDLNFQNFEEEIKYIDTQFGKSQGGIVLIFLNNEAIGCAGIRKLKGRIAELKRMYIKPRHRGQRLGKLLLEKSIELARELNYNKVRLDTMPTMHEAVHLYRAAGFYEIKAYRYNPLSEALYFELKI